MPRSLKSRIAAGEVVTGTLLTTPSPHLARAAASAGLDWLAVDLEHSPITIGDLYVITQATAGTPCTPLARVPSDSEDVLRRALDAGVHGVITPSARNATDVHRATSGAHYPPHGRRSVGPLHAAAQWGRSFPEYLRTADAEIVVMALIEDIAAIDDLQNILAVPGLDVAMIAPFDLSASMGLLGQITHEAVRAAIARAEATILRSSVALGGLSLSQQDALDKRARGYRVLTLGYDLMLFELGLRQLIDGVQHSQ